jgi:hypothetical protein
MLDMERYMKPVSLAGLKTKLPRIRFTKRPVNIRMILALHEAEKGMEKIRIEMDAMRRFNSLR